MNNATITQQLFYTDKQLCERWQCSHMKLWRLRAKGTLPKPIKLGGTGANLTPASVVKCIEGGSDASRAA